MQTAHATLFWHVGELALSGSTSRWRWREPAPPEPGAIPVLRLDLLGAQPLRQPCLADNLAKFANPSGCLQIDCDCPDRLLTEYAAFLAELRRRVPHVSATALAGWSGKPAFAELQAAVESLAVMFYDLERDPVRIGPDTPPLPLLEPQAFATRLAEWEACRVPWRAGLPNYSRITVYDPDGRCLGHIRNWTWDEVTFQRRLKFESMPAPGVVLLRVAADVVLAETPVKAGARLAVRWADRDVIASALDLVNHSHAAGVVWFRLPDSSDASGWSVAQLSYPSIALITSAPKARPNTSLGQRPRTFAQEGIRAESPTQSDEGELERAFSPDSLRNKDLGRCPRLVLSRAVGPEERPHGPSTEADGERSLPLILANDSKADLPARITGDGPGQRGYALELDAPAQDWREALPGDFWRVGAHADPDGKPSALPVPFATRLTFWFSHLRAGESLKTGLIQLAPGSSFRQIRYRILPGDTLWKPLD